MENVQRILVPLDGSMCAKRAFDWAASLAKAYKAELILLFVVDMNQKLSALDRVAMSGYEPAIFKMEGEKLLSIYQKAEPSISMTTEVLIGSPTEQIISAAETHAVDLIVMGSRGQSQMKQVVMGSVSQYVLHHADCPVMVVK